MDQERDPSERQEALSSESQRSEASQAQSPGSGALSPLPAGGFTPVRDLEPDPPTRKHSLPGILSFSMFIAMIVLFVILLVVFITKLGSVINLDNPDGVDPDEVSSKIQDMPELALVAVGMLGTLLGYIIGLVLGIVGLAQKNRKKVFPILGTVLNGLVIGGLLLLVLLGLAAASASA